MNHDPQGRLFGDSPSPQEVESAVAHIDGGSRGNPGPAAFGAYITMPDAQVVELKGFLPHSTNNVAEYNGLLAALRWAVEHGVKTLQLIASATKRWMRPRGLAAMPETRSGEGLCRRPAFCSSR